MVQEDLPFKVQEEGESTVQCTSDEGRGRRARKAPRVQAAHAGQCVGPCCIVLFPFCGTCSMRVVARSLTCAPHRF